MTTLEEYYNKFNEDKRLGSRHGQVEYVISMSYIHKCLEKLKQERCKNTETETAEAQPLRILDIGAATGGYSIPLWEEGYDVSAVEPVKHNLSRLKKKCPAVKAIQGNALNLKKYEDETFDLTLLFGPMYHLHTEEEQVQALKEALRVTKKDGYVLAAYIMNEYSVMIYAFREHHAAECRADGSLDDGWKCLRDASDLYRFVRLEDIDRINTLAGARRELIFAPDGPANYMRRELNEMSEEEFRLFIAYQQSVCERPELIGASAHTVDIVRRR